MTVVVLLGICAGSAVIGVAYGLSRRRPSLVGILDSWERTVPAGRSDPMLPRQGASVSDRLGGPIVTRVLNSSWAGHRWVVRARSDLEITGTAPEQFVSRSVVLVGCCALVPLVVWLLATLAGLGLPITVVALCVVVGVPTAVALPVAALIRRATDRRRHFVRRPGGPEPGGGSGHRRGTACRFACQYRLGRTTHGSDAAHRP
jgi:hypothetical protein